MHTYIQTSEMSLLAKLSPMTISSISLQCKHFLYSASPSHLIHDFNCFSNLFVFTYGNVFAANKCVQTVTSICPSSHRTLPLGLHHYLNCMGLLAYRCHFMNGRSSNFQFAVSNLREHFATNQSDYRRTLKFSEWKCYKHVSFYGAIKLQSCYQLIISHVFFVPVFHEEFETISNRFSSSGLTGMKSSVIGKLFNRLHSKSSLAV